MAFNMSVSQNNKAEGGKTPIWTHRWRVSWRGDMAYFECIMNVHGLSTQNHVCMCVRQQF